MRGLLALVLACARCAGDPSEPIGFLDLRLEAARPEGELRAAVMWADHGRGGVRVTDDQAVPAETSFEFSLRRLPPDEALRMVSNVDGPRPAAAWSPISIATATAASTGPA